MQKAMTRSSEPAEPSSDDSSQRLTRRSFIAGTGKTAAGLAVGAVGLEALVRTEAASAAPPAFDRGFNDVWAHYTENPDAGAANMPFYHAKYCGSSFVRQEVRWEDVWPEHNDASGNFTPPNFSKFIDTKNRAEANGMKVLPFVHSCAYWARDSASSGINGIWYPRPEFVPHYGDLVKEAMLFFDTPAVEIWNEPNIQFGGNVPAQRFGEMVQAVCNSCSHLPNRTLISGGLNPLGPSVSGDYLSYLTQFQAYAPSATYKIGLHPYDNMNRFSTWQAAGSFYTVKNNPSTGTAWTSNQAADSVVQTVLGHFDAAKSRCGTREIWLTETGCAFRAPFGRAGQGRALQGISNGLRLRARCKGLFVHRLYPPYVSSEDDPSLAFSRYQLTDAINGTPSSSYYALRDAWI